MCEIGCGWLHASMLVKEICTRVVKNWTGIDDGKKADVTFQGDCDSQRGCKKVVVSDNEFVA